jgi:hypothetical protein
MKLNHEVVRDLYPLYVDNELSPNVKEAVDSHLEECEACRICYKSGEGFFDRIKEIDAPTYPISIDEKLLLKIKLNRLKWISLVLTGIIFSILITNYINEREKLFSALSNYYSAQEFLPHSLDVIKNKQESDLENIQESFYQFFEDMVAVEDHLNFIEQHNLNDTEFHLSIDTSRLNRMLDIMQTRYDQGIWSEADEEAYQAIKKYFKDYNPVVLKEYRKMHHGYSSYLETLDVKKMDVFYKRINLLSYSYTRYHKLPKQLIPINQAKLKHHIAKVIEVPIDDIDLKKESSLNDLYTYRFEVNRIFRGLIDGLNGQIIEINGDTGKLSNKPLISKEDAEKRAKLSLERIYGSDLHLELIPLGFNYNYSSDDPRFKVYSFKAVPIVNHFKLYTPPDSGIFLYLDARNGKLEMFTHNPFVPIFSKINQLDLSIEVPKETLIKKGLPVKETVIIYSAKSGKFELVYRISGKGIEEEKLYSTKTGQEEMIYFNER